MTDQEVAKLIEDTIQETTRKVAAYLARTFVTVEGVRSEARQAVPISLRDLDASMGDGPVLMNVNGNATWGDLVSGLSAEGDKVLYKGVFLREYDEDGVIVTAGSDINPADYGSQALYEAALVAAGHSLKPTWDVARGGTDIT